MAVEMPSRLPFSVDTWTPASRRKPFHFLSHAHKDHTQGLESNARFPIYCSQLSLDIIRHRHPKLEPSLFVPISVNRPISLGMHTDNAFTVTAFDANHCTGALMFLFEGSWGNVLHTGDCRLSPDCLARIPRAWRTGRKKIDCLYLDCTFAGELQELPSKLAAAQQVLRLIWDSPLGTLFYFAVDMLGAEYLLQVVHDQTGLKFYVDSATMPAYYKEFMICQPGLITDDPSSTRLHVCEGFPRLSDRAKQKFAEADQMGKDRPVFIRPSTQWYTFQDRNKGTGSGLLMNEDLQTSVRRVSREDNMQGDGARTKQRMKRSAPVRAEKDEFGIWHVCYSMHSSFSELKMAIETLNPKHVIPNSKECRSSDVELSLAEVGAASTWKPSRILWTPLDSEGCLQRMYEGKGDEGSGEFRRENNGNSQKSGESPNLEKEKFEARRDEENGELLCLAGTKGEAPESFTSADIFVMSPGNDGRCFRALRPPPPPTPMLMLFGSLSSSLCHSSCLGSGREGRCTRESQREAEMGEAGGCRAACLVEKDGREQEDGSTAESEDHDLQVSKKSISESGNAEEAMDAELAHGTQEGEGVDVGGPPKTTNAKRSLEFEELEEMQDSSQKISNGLKILPESSGNVEVVAEQKKHKGACGAPVEPSFSSRWSKSCAVMPCLSDRQGTSGGCGDGLNGAETQEEHGKKCSVNEGSRVRESVDEMKETVNEMGERSPCKVGPQGDYGDVAVMYRYFHVAAPPPLRVSLMDLLYAPHMN